MPHSPPPQVVAVKAALKEGSSPGGPWPKKGKAWLVDGCLPLVLPRKQTVTNAQLDVAALRRQLRTWVAAGDSAGSLGRLVGLLDKAVAAGEVRMPHGFAAGTAPRQASPTVAVEGGAAVASYCGQTFSMCLDESG